MSVVIVGGNEGMAGQYETICRKYGYKARVYTKENGALKKKLGNPDLLILFTGTVSHKMVISAAQEAKRNRIPLAWVHNSSASSGAFPAPKIKARQAVSGYNGMFHPTTISGLKNLLTSGGLQMLYDRKAVA